MNYYLEQFINEKFLKPGKAIDLGAGKFYDIACLRQIGWKCEGIDFKTGINLEKPFIPKLKLFDLTFSNYVLHRINNREQFIKTAYNNLKKKGWLFLLTFDSSDKTRKKNKVYKRDLLVILKKQGFKKISTRVFSFYDNEPGHLHWHRILEVIAQK